jgi:hypothetical protein
MVPSMGVNSRVKAHCSQDGRKYTEDIFSMAYKHTEDEKDLEYTFLRISDGHWRREAATFAKEHPVDYIVTQEGVWSDKDEDILRAIRSTDFDQPFSLCGRNWIIGRKRYMCCLCLGL